MAIRSDLEEPLGRKPEKLCRVAALATSGARRPQTRLMPY